MASSIHLTIYCGEKQSLLEAQAYAVGERLVVSREPAYSRIVRIDPTRFLVEWPWLEVDPDMSHAWDGTMGFSRDPDA